MNPRRILLVAVLFAVLGPLVGTVAVILCVGIMELVTAGFGVHFVYLIPLPLALLPEGEAIGFVPALCSGLIVGALTGHPFDLRRGWPSAFIFGAIGVAMAFMWWVCLTVMSGGSILAAISELSSNFAALLFVGCIAGLASAVLGLRFACAN